MGKAASSKSLLSHCSFKNLQGELASTSKVVLETRAIEVSSLVYKVQGTILVRLTPVYHVIIHFPVPVIWHCKILLLLKGTNISFCSSKTSGLIPEKQNQGKRKREEPYQSIKGLSYQGGVTEPPSISIFPPSLPGVISSGKSFIHSPNYWANIHWLLWWTQCEAGLHGGDNVLGSLGLTWPRKKCRACSSEAPRLFLPVQPSGRRCGTWLPLKIEGSASGSVSWPFLPRLSP